MNITLNTDHGKIMINSDTVRIYVPMEKGGTSISFTSGARIEVQESLDEISDRLHANQRMICDCRETV